MSTADQPAILNTQVSLLACRSSASYSDTKVTILSPADQSVILNTKVTVLSSADQSVPLSTLVTVVFLCHLNTFGVQCVLVLSHAAHRDSTSWIPAAFLSALIDSGETGRHISPATLEGIGHYYLRHVHAAKQIRSAETKVSHKLRQG